MVRAKGGKRQPRYHRLKDAGAERLCRLLESRTPPEEEEDIITQMERMVLITDGFISRVKSSYGY